HAVYKSQDTSSFLSLRSAVRACKRRGAPGPECVTIKMPQNLPDSRYQELLSWFSDVWASSEFPAVWRWAWVVPVLKSGKFTGDLSSSRPVSLTSCVAKLFERLGYARLTWWLEGHHLPPLKAHLSTSVYKSAAMVFPGRNRRLREIKPHLDSQPLRLVKAVPVSTISSRYAVRRVGGQNWGNSLRVILTLHSSLVVSRFLQSLAYMDLLPSQAEKLERLHRAGPRTLLGSKVSRAAQTLLGLGWELPQLSNPHGMTPPLGGRPAFIRIPTRPAEEQLTARYPGNLHIYMDGSVNRFRQNSGAAFHIPALQKDWNAGLTHMVSSMTTELLCDVFLTETCMLDGWMDADG
ncbi:hypothetical protein HPB47_018859, partial [Ixodes persulcatus]